MLALVALLTRQARRAVPHRNRYANACAPQYFIKSPLVRNASRTAAGPVLSWERTLPFPLALSRYSIGACPPLLRHSQS